MQSCSISRPSPQPRGAAVCRLPLGHRPFGGQSCEESSSRRAGRGAKRPLKKCLPWPCPQMWAINSSLWATPQKAEVFGRCRSPHPSSDRRVPLSAIGPIESGENAGLYSAFSPVAQGPLAGCHSPHQSSSAVCGQRPTCTSFSSSISGSDGGIRRHWPQLGPRSWSRSWRQKRQVPQA